MRERKHLLKMIGTAGEDIAVLEENFVMADTCIFKNSLQILVAL